MAKNILDAISNADETTSKSGLVDAGLKNNIDQENKITSDSKKSSAKNLADKVDKEVGTNNFFSIEKTLNKEESDKKNEEQSDEIKTTKVDAKPKKKRSLKEQNIEITTAPEPLWLSVSEAAKTGGVEQKTIRRAIQSESVKFKIIKNRYLIEFASLVKYLSSNTKLRNKFLSFGIGQYIDKWK